jgi:hypothetical protein
MKAFEVLRSNPVQVQCRDPLEWIIGLRTATGTITLSGQPELGDWIQINDGLNVHTYEFVNSLSGYSADEVVIGATLEDTYVNLIDAINRNCEIVTSTGILIVDPQPGVFATFDVYGFILLVHSRPGSDYNLPVVSSGTNIIVSGMEGGEDAANAIEVSGTIDNMPTGLATSAKQDTAQTTLATINTAVTDVDTTIAQWKVTSAITASGLLTTYATITFETNLIKVTLIPTDSTKTINVNVGGAASAATAPIPGSGITFPITKAIADTIYVYAASSTELSVITQIPR